jgi:hypothetical protein
MSFKGFQKSIVRGKLAGDPAFGDSGMGETKRGLSFVGRSLTQP